MKCNLLVPNVEATSRVIYGVEIADTNQASTDLTARNNTYGVSAYGVDCVYSAVTVTSNIDTFINNYDQFFLINDGTIVPKAGYDATVNRKLPAMDRRYPYVCNNMQVNVGGAASVEGGVFPTTIAGDPV